MPWWSLLRPIRAKSFGRKENEEMKEKVDKSERVSLQDINWAELLELWVCQLFFKETREIRKVRALFNKGSLKGPLFNRPLQSFFPTSCVDFLLWVFTPTQLTRLTPAQLSPTQGDGRFCLGWPVPEKRTTTTPATHNIKWWRLHCYALRVYVAMFQMLWSTQSKQQ